MHYCRFILTQLERFQVLGKIYKIYCIRTTHTLCRPTHYTLQPNDLAFGCQSSVTFIYAAEIMLVLVLHTDKSGRFTIPDIITVMEPYLRTCSNRRYRYIVQELFTYVYHEMAHIKISVIYYTIQVTMTLNLRLLVSCFRANLFIVGCINVYKCMLQELKVPNRAHPPFPRQWLEFLGVATALRQPRRMHCFPAHPTPSLAPAGGWFAVMAGFSSLCNRHWNSWHWDFWACALTDIHIRVPQLMFPVPHPKSGRISSDSGDDTLVYGVVC